MTDNALKPEDIFPPVKPDEALRRLAQAAWYVQGGGPTDGLTDLQRSQQIWRQQDIEEAEERARLIRQIQYEESKSRF
jgi:hypothetical protein